MEDVPTEIFHDHPCHLGEGPTFDASTGTAYWFDILEKTLFEANVETRAVKTHALDMMASELAPIDDERQLVATERGLFVRTRSNGRMEFLHALESENSGTRSNDGRVHPSGALWIGTMGCAAETGAGSIYWFREGELRRLYANVTIPNAIAFTRDGTLGYWCDTRVGLLHRASLDPATGLPTGELETLYDHRGGEGGLDGAVVDSEGLIWNARWGASCLDAYSPEGARVRTVRIPATRPSCPIFVGKGFDRVLVTTASEGMGEADKAADPNHGKTFLLDLGVRGFAEPRVKAFPS